MKKLGWFLLLTVFLAGCTSFPLRPGRAEFISPSGVVGRVQQSQNPKAPTTQKYRRTQEGGKVTEEVDTVIGAAQKDVARELGAKLASLKGVVWVGILVFLFGAASFVWPPLKLIVGGSVTTSAVISGAGLAMIVLPTLVVGNEILILCGASAVAVLWWFAHRHGKLQGFVDANRDGIDDRRQ